MINVWIAFITGLTTGGLGCLALQGGLLASSLAQQVEAASGQRRTAVGSGGHGGWDGGSLSGVGVARSIGLFLGAKVAAHGILGLLLGALGSLLRLNFLTRALLQLGIGIFMVGNALRMLDVHPIFRTFVFEPPSFMTRTIRRTSRRKDSTALPLALGLLTVFIPCGITQAMMATAMATGDALMGGALMAAFTLGTTPMFFTVAYSAMRVGARLERAFMRVIAIVVLLLGLMAIESGLNLLGSPVSASRLIASLRPETEVAPVAAPTADGPVATEVEPTVVAVAPEGAGDQPAEDVDPDPGVVGQAPTPDEPDVQTLYVQAKHDGYVPPRQHAIAGMPSRLVLLTDLTRSCTRALAIPALNFETYLPETGQVTVGIPPMEAGTVLRYSCAAGIYTGEIIFDR